MKKNKLVASFAGISMSICVTLAVAQTAVPEKAQKVIAGLAKQRAIFLDSVDAQVETIGRNGGKIEITICQGIYRIDPSSVVENPHLTGSDWFVLFGPLPFSNAYQLSTVSISGYVPPWKPGSYRAVPDISMIYPEPSSPEWFNLEPVPVMKAGSHEEERNHFYKMQVTDRDEDGCPTYVIFHHHRHEGDIVLPMHPGHAGASRD